jgi:hypothetical protein
MLERRSLWLQVSITLSSTAGGIRWLRKMPTSYNPCTMSSRVCSEIG